MNIVSFVDTFKNLITRNINHNVMLRCHKNYEDYNEYIIDEHLTYGIDVRIYSDRRLFDSGQMLDMTFSNVDISDDRFAHSLCDVILLFDMITVVTNYYDNVYTRSIVNTLKNLFEEYDYMIKQTNFDILKTYMKPKLMNRSETFPYYKFSELYNLVYGSGSYTNDNNLLYKLMHEEDKCNGF